MSTVDSLRRQFLRTALGAGALAALGPGWARAQDKPGRIRIGYQKYGTLVILKARGALEKRLATAQVEVQWNEFPAGPQLLEALNVGSIDFGTVGEAPPIFAQAAGADLVYVGCEPASPAGEALVVPHDSPIQSVAELKGKKVALNKGSNVHYLLVRALEHAGVAYRDVSTVFLPPADARAAFESKNVDAWAIWDPFLAAAQIQIGARILADGQGLVSNHQFYLAARSFAQERADLTRIVFEELGRVDAWGKDHPKELAALLAPQLGLEPGVLELAASRYGYGVTPVSPAVIAEQQKIADTFADLKLIPRPILVKNATLATTGLPS